MLEGYMNFSGKPKEQAERELKEVIDVLINASSYMFGYNHSTGYSMLGYLCGYYRYYHPLEFICSILNNADNMEDTVSGIELAKLKNIKILSPKFGYSAGKYMPSKETNSIYKGIGSIKGLNETVGDELYKLGQEHEKFDNFLLLLMSVTDLTSCTSAHLNTLIKLNFFSDYGKSKKLLRILELFLKFSKKDKVGICIFKQQFKKDKLEEDTIKLIRKYSENESEKTLSKVDTYSMLQDIISKIPNEDIAFKDSLSNELEYLGYIDYKNDKLEKRYALITELNTKYTPIVNTYCLNNGVSCKCKIGKKIWNNCGELKEKDVIYIHSMEKKFGWKKVGEKTDKKGNVKPVFEVDETKQEWHITNYSIIPNMEEILNEL
jgi:DNA polymerase-3 subunit alpha